VTSTVDWNTARAELTKPLNSAVVATREQAGRKLSYVEGWHVIAEANRIFGYQNWTRETVEMRETHRELVHITSSRGNYEQWRVSYLAKVRVTVDGVVREGTGYGSGMGKPEALGDAIESAAKEAETDAMKRAFMTFGNPFGLALYDKTQANVSRDEPEPPAPPAASHLSKAQSRDEYDRMAKEIRDVPTLKMLKDWLERNTAAIDKIHPDFADGLLVEFNDRKSALTKVLAA
jgi:DNA repair and recombination protein RAD52